MDGQKIKRKFRIKPSSASEKNAWFELAPYIFMGTVFVLGFAALLLVIQGQLSKAGRIILAAMIFAGLEYPIRRYATAPSSMEDEFSSLADILCFSVVPGLLIYRLAFQDWGILGVAGLFILVFGGVVRLSLSRLYNPAAGKRGFIGIPLSISAAFIALVAQLLVPERILPFDRLMLLAGVLALTFLTVSTLPYPNPLERPGVFLIAALCVVAVFFQPPIRVVAAWLLLAGGAVFMTLAPWWMRQGGRKYG